MAVTALMLIPMLVFTAFATDVGAWYVRAQEIQRAADAAALAAVVWMPDEDQAADIAYDVSARNGFRDRPGDFDDDDADLPQVQVSRVGNQRVRVDIRAEGDLYFGSVLASFEAPAITRYATAEYVLPVPIGNPTSQLGGGSDVVNGRRDNFWLRANSDCIVRAQGDLIGAAAPTCSSSDIPIPNPNHYPDGHPYVIDVPAGASGQYVLQARHTCWNTTDTREANGTNVYTLYPPDETLLDDLDNATSNPPTVSGVSIGRPDTAICDIDGSDWTMASDPAPWVDIYSTPLTEGRWLLYADNNSSSNNERATYSLRLDPVAASGAVCSRIGASASSDCPNISGVDWLTVYSHNTMFPGNSGSGLLYLGEIGEHHAGKLLQIRMFDPADGIDIVRIIMPDGTPADVTWRTIDVSEFDYTGHGGDIGTGGVTQTCSGIPCISQNGSLTEQGTGYSFQDRTILVEIEIPADYECVDNGVDPLDCWWEVQYDDIDGNTNETTTWGVRVIGDPVRLIE